MLQPFFAHQNRRLLAADAAGAKADHGLVLEGGFVGPKRIREIAEFADAPIHRARECSFVHLKGIARVQGHDRAACVVLARIQPAPHRGGTHRRGAALRGLDRRVVHADDFALDLDQ